MPSKKNQTLATPVSAAEESVAPSTPDPVPPVQVLYCAGSSGFILCIHDLINVERSLVCSFPPEYCEFGSSLTRCKEWLKENHINLYDKYYSEGKQLVLLNAAHLQTHVAQMRSRPKSEH